MEQSPRVATHGPLVCTDRRPRVVAVFFEVARKRRKRAVDVPLAACLDARELRLVEQTNREVVHDVDRALLLDRLSWVQPAPANDARPTGKLSDHPCQVIRPSALGDLERFERSPDGVLTSSTVVGVTTENTKTGYSPVTSLTICPSPCMFMKPPRAAQPTVA